MKFLRPLLFVAASFGAALLLLVFHSTCQAQCPGGVCRPAAVQPCPCALGGPCLCAPGQCSCPGCQARVAAPAVVLPYPAPTPAVYFYLAPRPAYRLAPPRAGCQGGHCHRR